MAEQASAAVPEDRAESDKAPERPGYGRYVRGVATLCLRCGSLVEAGYRAVHDDWHLRVERGI